MCQPHANGQGELLARCEGHEIMLNGNQSLATCPNIIIWIGHGRLWRMTIFLRCQRSLNLCIAFCNLHGRCRFRSELASQIASPPSFGASILQIFIIPIVMMSICSNGDLVFMASTCRWWWLAHPHKLQSLCREQSSTRSKWRSDACS